MCMASTPHIPDPIPPLPPAPPVPAPILDADTNKQTMNNDIARKRLGKKALQIPLTKNTQSGLAIPTAA